jgi:serine/threonine protein phosphatase PrpC
MTIMAQYRYWVASDVGRIRTNNEDAVLVHGLADTRPSAWGAQLPCDGWAFVADGVGGNAAGEVASELTVQMLATVSELLRTPNQIESVLRAIHLELKQAMDRAPEFKGMGTTVAGIMLEDAHGLVFNLGDSRIYHLNDSGLQQISKDHHDGSYLTGLLGGSSPGLAAVPHCFAIRISPGDQILLCTDGLTDRLSDQEIFLVLTGHSEQPARALVEAALEAGGHDNVTAVVIRCEAAGVN